MKCNCRSELEAKLTARFKEQVPDATDHKVDLQGYGFGITDTNEFVMRGLMPYKAGATYPLKKGGTKWKQQTGNMVFSYCPFCGEKAA